MTRCAVPDCQHPTDLVAPLLIGGTLIITAWCGRHAAEYRVYERTVSEPLLRLLDADQPTVDQELSR